MSIWGTLFPPVADPPAPAYRQGRWRPANRGDAPPFSTDSYNFFYQRMLRRDLPFAAATQLTHISGIENARYFTEHAQAVDGWHAPFTAQPVAKPPELRPPPLYVFPPLYYEY